MGKLINIDNGGTLTDIWVLDGSQCYYTKTLTTSYDLSKCFFEGLKKVSHVIYGHEDLASLLHSTDHIRYSTTQGTNALIEKKGPPVGLIVNEGFDITRLHASKDARDIFSAIVGERIAYVPVDVAEDSYKHALISAVNQLGGQGAQRIVVAFEHPEYDVQEKRFYRESLKIFPRHMLGALPILFASSLTADASPERRCWTALYNAFLHPELERFLYYSENMLRKYRVANPLLIYRNDGYSGRVAKTIAMKTYDSGPRAGLEAVRAYVKHYGLQRAASIDIGGTSTDVGFVNDGEPATNFHGDVHGAAVSIPLCDMKTLSVAGGSVFRVNNGSITIGPDSVGAAPGPACFGRGGNDATITDALLVMGLLDPSTYYGGGLQLDVEKAAAAVHQHVAEPLKLDLYQAVHNMLDGWAGEIAKGISQSKTVGADTVLFAFGGSGPLAATRIADALNISKVLVPRHSAVFSAQGIAFSDIGHLAMSSLDGRSLDEIMKTLAKRVTTDMFSEGFGPDQCSLEAWLETEEQRIPIDMESPALPSVNMAEFSDTMRVCVRALRTIAHAEVGGTFSAQPSAKLESTERTLFNPDGSQTSLPVLQIARQSAGIRGKGPMVVEEDYWTCLVGEFWEYEITDEGDLLLNKAY